MANALSIGEMSDTSYQKYDTFNMAIKYLTALMTGARDRITALPTGIENACWIITTGFSPYSTNDLLFYFGGSFYGMTPVEGLCLWVWDEDCIYEYTGGTWQKRSTTTLTGGNWKVLYTNGSGVITELSLPATGNALIGQGASAAPIFGNITSIIAAGNWKIFYSNGSAAITELTLGAAGQALISQGATSAPTFGNVTAIAAAGNWKVFYSNGSAAINELAAGATGTVLRSAGPAAAPEFATAETRLASITVNLQAGDSKTDIYTVPASKKLVVTKVVIRGPSDSMTGGTDFDLGDGANADTWVNAVDLSGLGTAQYRVISGDNANFTIFDAGDVFGIKPVTGATADVTATADLFGYLYDA